MNINDDPKALLALLRTYDLQTLEEIASGKSTAPSGLSVSKSPNSFWITTDKLELIVRRDGSVATFNTGRTAFYSASDVATIKALESEIFALKFERRTGGDGQFAGRLAAEKFDREGAKATVQPTLIDGVEVSLALGGTNNRPGATKVIADPALNPKSILKSAEEGLAQGVNAQSTEVLSRGERASRATKQGSVGYLDLFAKADGAINVGILDVLNQRASIDSIVQNKPEATAQELGRPAWLPLAQNEKTGPLLRDMINADANRSSASLKDALDDFGQNGGKAYWPEIVLGGGPQGANYAFSKAQNNPRAGLLVIEASDELGGGNFAKIGEAFNLNSSNRPQTGARPKAGTSETINPLASPVTPNDLSGRRWGAGETIATASSIAVMASGADVLMQERIENVRDRVFLEEIGEDAKDWPGRYAVRLSSGRTVYTDRLVVASGLGTEANLDAFDASCRAFIKSELDKVDPKTPDDVPRVLTVPDALELGVKSQNGRAAYREGVTAIIGPGDGSRVFLEYLHGLGPESAYTGKGRLDTAQQGVIGGNLWFVGEKGPRDCDEYKDSTRPRYAQLQALLKANDGNTPRVQLAASRVSKIEEITEGADKGRLRLTYQGYAAGDAKSKVPSSYTAVVDRVVLGTGYDRDVGALFRGVLGREAKDYKKQFEDVRGKPSSFNEEVIVARRLKSSPGVCFVGPAAGQLPSDDELVGIKENAVGLFANTPRTEAFAAANAKVDPVNRAHFVHAAMKPRVLAAGSNGQARIAARQSPNAMATSGDNTLAVKVGLASALKGFSGSQSGTIELKVRQVGEELMLEAPSIESGALAPLAQAISAEPGLAARLEAMTGRNRQVKLSVASDDTGKLRMETLELTTSRVALDPNVARAAPMPRRARTPKPTQKAAVPKAATPVSSSPQSPTFGLPIGTYSETISGRNFRIISGAPKLGIQLYVNTDKDGIKSVEVDGYKFELERLNSDNSYVFKRTDPKLSGKATLTRDGNRLVFTLYLDEFGSYAGQLAFAPSSSAEGSGTFRSRLPGFTAEASLGSGYSGSGTIGSGYSGSGIVGSGYSGSGVPFRRG